MTTLDFQALGDPIRLDTDYFNNHTHALFAWLREHRPVTEARLNRRTPVYLITRYADVEAALLDNKRFIKNPHTAKANGGSGGFWMPKAFRPLTQTMLNTDEPDHRRLRNLVHKGFTPKRIAELEGAVEQIAADLLVKAKRKGTVDLIADFALPLPVAVISHLIGIPEEEKEKFALQTSKFLVNPTPFNMVKAIPSIMRFTRYIRDLAERKRRNPQDDLLSALVLAEENGERFSEDELIGMIFLLFVAGHETTVNLIANGTFALLQHPEQFDLLKSDTNLIRPAIEEMLRFNGPLETTEMSFASEDVTLHGVTIPKGATVLPSILSANRDDSVFEAPDRFDITRTPNKHLAFGKGIHFCLGAPLARLEGKVAFCQLLQQAPDIRLAVPKDAVRYRNMVMIHRLEALPVVL